MFNKIANFFTFSSNTNDTIDDSTELEQDNQSNNKLWITYNDTHNLVKSLCMKITTELKRKDLKVDVIVCIGTGGWFVGRVANTYLDVPIGTVTYKSYVDESQRDIKVVQWLPEEFINNFITGKNVLILDELNDTGSTLYECTKQIKTCGPNQVIVGVLHHKNKPKTKELDDDVHYYYSKEIEDKWIVYPWEAQNIETHDYFANK